MRAPFLLALVACEAPVDFVPGEPACDGFLQDGEGAVDGPWDLDGDGHVTDADADCRQNYGANRLDCDDSDSTVNASAIEIPCNGIDDDCNPDTPDEIDRDADGAPACTDCDDDNPFRSPTYLEECGDQVDNDCSGVIDQDCPDDYNGIYAVDQDVRLTCKLQLISIDFDQLGVVHNGEELAMYSVGGGNPGTMEGPVDEDGNFMLVNMVETGACTQTNTLEGFFTSESRFEATLEVDFGGFSCLLCNDRTWKIVGSRALVP